MKKMTDWALARRDVLKTLGVGAAMLPLLRTSPARAAGTRKVAWIILTSEGYRQADWKPQTGPLAGQTLPFSTAPLEPVKDQVIVLPDLGNGNFVPPNGGGGHGSYGSIFWGLDPGHVSYKQPTGKTLDQVLATVQPGALRATLPLMVQLNRSPQSEPSQLGSSHCFWLAKGQPINPIGDPYATYMEIFGGAKPGTSGQDDPAVQRLMVQRMSLLDYVGRNIEAFKGRLGADDRMSIEAHQQAIRDLEKQLQGAGQLGKCGGDPGEMINLDDGLQYPNILTAQMKLGVSALKCGVTNVATLQLSDSSGNNIGFGFVPGVPTNGTGYKSKLRNYHDLGHNPVFMGVDSKRIVDRWMMQQFATLIQMMQAVPGDGGGTLLDQGVILWGNHMQDGSNHVAGKIPWLLAGKCGGYFKTGQCADSTGKQLNGVMTDIVQAFGGTSSPFGPTWAGLKA
jgi:hypothetical protein